MRKYSAKDYAAKKEKKWNHSPDQTQKSNEFLLGNLPPPSKLTLSTTDLREWIQEANG